MKIHFNTSAITIALLSGGLLLSCTGDNHEEIVKKANPVKVTVGVAGTSPHLTVNASGQIEAKETAVISTRVMGFITSIKVKEGDRVQKGQLLATISSADILAKRAQAQAMVSEAEAALKDAQKDYERFAELYKQNSASTKEFENATLHYNSVKSKTEAARQIKNEAEAMLTYTNLVAPFTGVITQINSDAGSMANPGVPILMVEQSGSYQVGASISEADIAKVKHGAAAEVLIKSTGRKLNGKISEVSPSSQYSGGQYKIKVDIDPKEQSDLYSGMYANVTIALPGEKNQSSTVLIPESAILYKDQLTGLYTITENQTALLRWVRLGKAQGTQVEILSGLRSDEKFILESESKLYNGVPVSIK